MGLTDKTTVEKVPNAAGPGTVWLVGEEHYDPGAKYSEELVEQVIQKAYPDAVAIESTSGSYTPDSSAMGRLVEYSELSTVPAFKIDKSRTGLQEAIFEQGEYTYSELLKDANKFSYEIQEDGDVDVRAIRDARNRVREKYSREVYNEMYIRREKAMAERLNKLSREFETVVAAVGAFHVPSIKNMIPVVGTNTDAVTPNRTL